LILRSTGSSHEAIFESKVLIRPRTTELMKAAHELGGQQIKRFVLLGSAVAVLDSGQDITVAGKDYTEEDWNPVRSALYIKDP
jgi:hypothetical protein